MSNLITARKNYIPPSYIRAAAADKHANPWNYADDISTVSLWMNSDASRGGLFNMTKAANPLSKANIGSTLSGVTSVLGPVVSNLISDGYSAGSGFNTVMSTVLALNTGNPVVDTIKNVAATAILGLGNRAFGTKRNETNINALNVNKAQARTTGTTLGSASTTNDLLASSGQMTGGMGFKTTDLVKGGWFAKGKARKQGLGMLNQETAALAYLNHGLQTGANNVDTKQDSMVMRNFAALGGPLMGVDPSTAIGYQLYTDKYVRDNNRSVPNMFAGTPKIFALGGGHLFPYGGGTFTGAGTTSRWGDEHADSYPEARNFNEAFDRAVAENQKTFWFQGREYSTQKENNPVREYNNRWVGAMRDPNVKNPSKAYDRLAGPIGGPLSLVPIVTDTYSPTREPVPELELRDTAEKDYDLVDRGLFNNIFMPTYMPKNKPIKRALGGDIQTHGADWDTGVNHVNVGGTHEENPYDGVLMGVDQLNVPNLVEEGEVIYKDYVFSNRLDIPKYDRKDTSREAKALRKYSGKTFADTAKKIEKRMGADERTDAITKAGLDVELQLLAQVLEKERQKLQLLEMQDAIDNMTPEEFAMLQLQMQAQQDAEALQEAMAQQQQMIPQGMEQMAPPEEMMSAYGGPIYALGGLLEDNDNVYAYGGSFEDFNKDLKERGLTLEDYLRYLVTTGALSLEEAAIYSTDKDAVLLENSFNKELAEKYLNSLNTKEKEVARMYRKKGQNPKKLTGAALQKYQEDVIKATKNPELLDKDADKLLFINLIGKSKPEAFNAAANAAIVKENRDAFLPEITLNDNGKIAIQYNNEGTIPQALSFLQNGLTYDGKKWKDALGNIVDNPYSKEYGFTGVSRDWSKYGYLNPKDNTWTNVDYNPPTEASGNTDYRYSPWNLWFTLSGMNADEYEAQDAYLNNYLDFLDDIYNKESPNHQAALRRLYEMGEATKSNAPGELKGKNRYFDTDKEGFDANNLSLDNLRTVDGNNTIGDKTISGFSVYNKAASDKAGISNKLYYANKNGLVISPTTFLELDEKEKKDWTPLDHKGLTRQDVLSHLKAVRNIDEDSEPDNLLFKSMFDNNPAQSYLMAPNGTRRYALVDELGNYIKDGDNIRYLDYNPDATYNFYKKNGTDVTPVESLMIDGVNVDTIGVLGGTVDNHIGVRRNPDGTWLSYRLTPEQAAKLKQREIASTDERYSTLPQFEEAVGGYTLNPHYYELDDDAYKSLGFNDLGYTMNGLDKPDPFPRAPWWPYLAGAGLLLASLGYNILSPKDYSNANAMIKAAQEAGNFTPVEFKPIGNYMTYRPMDIWAELNRMNAAARATDRAIMNSSSPYSSKVAGLLASGYNEQLGSGELFKKSLEYNDALNKQVAEFNKDTDKFNSEGLLKRDMANQDAATRARGFTLEGLKSGYAMRQAIDDARSNAISAGISGLANLAYNYAANKYNQDLMGWGMRHNSWGPGVYLEKDAPKKTVSTPTYVSSGARGSMGAKGGKLKVRRKKGLGF